MAAVAEFESRRIGERNKAAFAAMKARGGRAWKKRVSLNNKFRKLAREARRRSAIEFRTKIRPIIKSYRDKGYEWSWIAGKLNEDRVWAWGGGTWRLANVARVMTVQPWE